MGCTMNNVKYVTIMILIMIKISKCRVESAIMRQVVLHVHVLIELLTYVFTNVTDH